MNTVAASVTMMGVMIACLMPILMQGSILEGLVVFVAEVRTEMLLRMQEMSDAAGWGDVAGSGEVRALKKGSEAVSYGREDRENLVAGLVALGEVYHRTRQKATVPVLPRSRIVQTPAEEKSGEEGEWMSVQSRKGKKKAKPAKKSDVAERPGPSSASPVGPLQPPVSSVFVAWSEGRSLKSFDVAPFLKGLDNPLGAMFRHIRESDVNYRLVSKDEVGEFLIVHVMRDMVFQKYYATKPEGAANLYRGMVLRVIREGEEGESGHAKKEPSSLGKEDNIRIIHIAKLKCLQYMVRTFMHRNLLSMLLRAPASYIEGLQNFLRIWEVPASYHPVLLQQGRLWMEYVTSLSVAEKESIKANFLDHFEDRFLPLCRGKGIFSTCPAGNGDADQGSSNSLFNQEEGDSSVKNDNVVILVNFSPLQRIYVEQRLGKDTWDLPKSLKGKKGRAVLDPATLLETKMVYYMERTFPPMKVLFPNLTGKGEDAISPVVFVNGKQRGLVLLYFSPFETKCKFSKGNADDGDTSSSAPRFPDEGEHSRLQNMWRGAVSSTPRNSCLSVSSSCSEKELKEAIKWAREMATDGDNSGQKAEGRTLAIAKSPHPSFGIYSLSTAGHHAPGHPPCPIVNILTIAALPPGGGKTTVFKALHNKYGFPYISSDDHKDRMKFENALMGAIKDACISFIAKQSQPSPSSPSSSSSSSDPEHYCVVSPTVLYDKNIPDYNGWSRLLKVLRVRKTGKDVPRKLPTPLPLDEIIFHFLCLFLNYQSHSPD